MSIYTVHIAVYSNFNVEVVVIKVISFPLPEPASLNVV